MNRILTALLLCFLACANGCISLSGTTLDGTELRYPVSMSKSILDRSGQAYKPTDAEKVAHFKRDWSHWGMFYDVIPLSSDVNLSEVLHEEIEKAGGNGIVNLKVRADGSGLSWFISLLIIFPERIKVVVEGDVIKSSRAGQ